MEEWQDWKTGEPKALGELWTLRKRTHEVSCVLVGHPVGSELRLLIDGRFERSQAFREGAKAVVQAAEWRELFEAKGWTLKAPA